MESSSQIDTFATEKSEGENEPIGLLEYAGTVFTLTNSALGASVLALPFAFRHAGVILGSLMILALAFVGRFVDWRLLHYGHRFKRDTYPSMIIAALGDRMGIVLSLIVGVALFAGLVSLVILIGDLVTPIMQVWFGKGSFLSNRVYLTLIISLVFIVPIATLPKIDSLKYTSFLTVVSLIFMTIAAVIHCSKQAKTEGFHLDRVVWWNWNWNAIRSPPIIWYNTGFIFQVLPTLGPARGPKWTTLRITGVFTVVTTITTGLMFTLGLAGYFTFYETTNGNLLTNYPVDDVLIGVCRVLVAVVALSTYPLFNMPFREVLFWCWGIVRGGKLQAAPNSPAKEAELKEFSGSLDSSSSNSTETTDDSVMDSPQSTSDSPENIQATDKDLVPLDIESSDITPTPTEQELRESNTNTESQDVYTKEVLLKNFAQAFLTWLAAFLIAYVVPDITVAIGFVGWCLSPLYYFVLPALVGLSIAYGRKAAIAGAVFMLGLGLYFELAGVGSLFLPKLTSTPPLTHTNSTL